MSAFADQLTHGSWYLQIAGGGYLASSSSADPSGDLYVGTSPSRGTASKLVFNVTATSTGSATATIKNAATNRFLAVDAGNAVVFSASASTFTVTQRGSSVISLQSTSPAGNVAYDPTSSRFLVGSSPAALMLLAIDPPASGQLWTRQFGTTAVGGPATFRGFQVVSGSGPFLTCFEAFTGSIAWEFGDSFAATSPAVVGWAAGSALAAAGSTVYAVSMARGVQKWTQTVSSSVYARPRAFGDTVFVCGSYGIVHALAMDTGTPRWQYPTTGSLQGLYATPAMFRRVLYVGGWDGSLHAIDVVTGQQKWAYASGNPVNGVPLATEKAVFVGDDVGSVSAIDPATGTNLWLASVDGIVQSRPALYGSWLIVATLAGTVFGLDAATGSQLWTCSAGAPVASDVAVSDGVAYVTTTTGDLCALTLTGAGTPTLQSRPLGGASSGSPNVFSGTVSATTVAGIAVSTSIGFRTDQNPQDMAAALHASDLANQVTATTSPTLPSGWTLVGKVVASNTKSYGTGLVATLRRPSDDVPVVLVAFGAIATALLDNYDAATATTEAVPVTIAGPSAPTGVAAEQTVVDNYMSMRSALLGLIGGLAGKTLLVTGHAQGGALATLAALDYGTVKSDTPSPAGLRLITFGSPAAGNATFATFFNGCVQSSLRVVAEGDPTIDSLGAGWVHVDAPVTLGQGFPSLPGAGTVPMYGAAMVGVA